MIPAALTALVREHDCSTADFESLRVCRAAADKVSLELQEEFAHLVRFPIDEGYGMTEVGLATLNPVSGVIKRGSIGRPVPGYSISIRDQAGQEGPAGADRPAWVKAQGGKEGELGEPHANPPNQRAGRPPFRAPLPP